MNIGKPVEMIDAQPLSLPAAREEVGSDAEWCATCLECDHEFWESDIRPLCDQHNPAITPGDVSLYERQDGCICQAVAEHDATHATVRK
jgi:hypothetical protein